MDLVGGSEISTARAIEKLVSLLTEESRLIRGVDKSEVESLKNELEVIRVFLRDADGRSENEELSDAVKFWLLQSKEVAELIEDIVDEYILKASQRQYERGFVSFLGRAGRLIGTLNNRRKLSSDIQNIKEMLYGIKRRGQVCGIVGLSRKRAAIAQRYQDQMIYLHLMGSIVGIDSVANELMQRLVEGASGRSIISLVGNGGIGKTTLAQKVYNNGVIRGHFDWLAWIIVSESYNLEHLLRNMVRQIGAAGNHDVQDISIMRGDELIATLRQYLQSKRYLFVFDDVWQEEFWQEVGHALPDNEAGSRVIITTRFDTVAASFETTSLTHVLRVQPLSVQILGSFFVVELSHMSLDSIVLQSWSSCPMK